MTRQTTIQFDEERKSIQLTSTTDQQIRDLVESGYGSNMTAVIRHSVREAWERGKEMEHRYSVSIGTNVPTDRTWRSLGERLMTYKQAAAYAAKIIANEGPDEITAIMVWDMNFEAAERTIGNKAQIADVELQNPEHAYIATAMANAIKRKSSVPALIVTKTEIVHRDDISIKTARGTLTDGYVLAVTLRHNDKEITVDSLNLLVTEHQSMNWCIAQCERLATELARQERYAPGQIMRLLHCGFQPIASLGIPVPPVRKHATAAELKKFRKRTGKPFIYQENEAWREYAIAFNAWIKEHPALADDYGCTPQDEEWEPVK